MFCVFCFVYLLLGFGLEALHVGFVCFGWFAGLDVV